MGLFTDKPRQYASNCHFEIHYVKQRRKRYNFDVPWDRERTVAKAILFKAAGSDPGNPKEI
jgi:hypothetical protein